MKKLPIGLSDLSESVKGDYLYIDKSEFVAKLLGQKYFFYHVPAALVNHYY